MKATLKEHKKYMAGQTKCGLKVGDRVKLLRKAKSHEKGWDNSWEEEMDLRVGHTGRISSIGCVGISVEFWDDYPAYSYPFYVLKKVRKARGTK
jgi:hypothetical protein